MGKIKLVNTKEITLPAYVEFKLQTPLSIIQKGNKNEISVNTDKGLFILELTKDEIIELVEKINSSL